MNIAIDARLLERKITGVGRFLLTFLNELPNIDKNNNYLLFSYEPLKISNNFYKNVPTVKSKLPQKIFSPIWSNFILPKYLKENNIDILFSANQTVPLRKPKGIKYISMIHDVIYMADKRFHPFIYRKYLHLIVYFSIQKSDYIITVSNHSKKDILKYYKVKEDKIKVVHLAAEKNFAPAVISEEDALQIKKKFNSSEHIVLYLGMIEKRKNITCILRIADEIEIKNKNIKFLLIGKIGYGGDKIFLEIKKRSNILYLNEINDDLLSKLYNISSAFLFPSYYEGFGFPPLEAMQSGLPVLTSDNSSLKEIVGSGGIMHNADDVQSFVTDILKLIEDKEFSSKMKKRGIEQAKKFDICITVKKIVDIFESVK